MDELDSFRETSLFEKKLNHYRETSLAEAAFLVDKELEQTDAHQAGSAETGQATLPRPPTGSTARSPGSSRVADGVFVDDLRRLKERLEALRQGDGVVAFDEMRKPFDDAFYYVDKRTLSEVERRSGAGCRPRGMARRARHRTTKGG